MNTDTNIAVQPAPLSADQERWIEAAYSEIRTDRLGKLLEDLVNIPSPTGEERAIAQFLARYLQEAGLEGRYQPIDDDQGNAVGRYRGSGGGADLLLFAPIDAAFAGDETEDVPWIGPTVRADLAPAAFIVGDYVVGQAAENPKAFAACVVAAAEAVKRAGVPLKGSLLVGLAAGGMPTNKRPGLKRFNTGQGNGASFMIEQGIRGDFAILAKPGYAVSWEEVGLCWFKVQVKGALNYTGIRHLGPYKNPIVDAAKVIQGLEDWFPQYTARHTDGLVAPQGSIGAIEGGWTYKPAFVPAACNLYVDIRIGPRTEPLEVKRELGEALARIQAANPGLEVDCELLVSTPGTHTDPHNWVVQTLMRAWESREGTPHQARANTSGATDAAILRSRGMPTARLGMPRIPPLPEFPGFSMGFADVHAMQRLTECLVYAIVDTLTRERTELGLRA